MNSRILSLILALAISLPFIFQPEPAKAETHEPQNGDIPIGGMSEVTVWSPATTPWFSEMVGSSYTTRVKEFLNIGQVLEVEREGQSLFLQPMALEWTNDLDQLQQIAMTEASIPFVHDSEIEWFDAYGPNIDFAWEVTPGRLNKTLTIAGFSDLPPPEAYLGGNPELTLNLLFDPDSTFDIFVNDSEWDKKTKTTTFDNIEFRYLGETLYSFAPLMFWDSEGNEAQSIATLEKRGNSLYISIRVPYSWLQTAVFPIFIDADVIVGTSSYGSAEFGHTDRIGPFWTDNETGYVIHIRVGQDIAWTKTTDGGASWLADNNIVTDAAVSLDCWADWQTDGDAGTEIHCAYIDTGTDIVGYLSLDTSDDSETTATVEAAQGDGTILATISRASWFVSITKSRAGVLYVAGRYVDNSAASFTIGYDSTDGAVWNSIATPVESGVEDYFLLFPANLADNEDIWSLYWDWSANEVSLKTYDDSGDSWSEASISGSMAEQPTIYINMSGQVRLSDGHLIVTAYSQYNNPAADLRAWDITDAGTITAKTEILTNSAQTVLTSVFINQVNDDIYVSYIRGTAWQSLVNIFYKKSDDGGATWGGETAMSANAEDDLRIISGGAIKAVWGGRFAPVWHNDDLLDLFVNPDNSIDIQPPSGVSAPTVVTVNATDVSFTTVTGNGNITATGGANATDRGFQYGIAAFTDNITEAGDFGTGNFTGSITGLTHNTEYQYRAFAENSANISFGASVNFTTLEILVPTVVTVNATSVSFTTATGNGNITDLTGANATSRGFQYGIAAFTDNVSEGGDFGTGNFTLAITALTHNTEYQYRAFAENTAGIGFGGSVNFTTLEILIPVVVTGNATGITSSTATGQGNIITLTGANATVRGFQFGIGDFSSNVSESGDFSTGNYTLEMSGLTANTTYQHRAFAQNTAGIGFGASVNFTTLVAADIIPPGLSGGGAVRIFTTPVQLTAAMLVFAFFLGVAFWREHAVAFMCAAGSAAAIGLSWFHVFTNNGGLVLGLMFIAVSFFCIGMAFRMLFFSRGTEANELSNS